ncbi:hypothetical protein BD833_103145 [Blastococcus xanthinilyticus]|uniref:Uncharacterized protein n=1 Tax=Blastococcus xanthinilyticus TaxID=1564164 RepID=A0A5S5D2X8_9ACTN|nr:hypothetical protein BD833_103145 [Blastococcus xanthinilyticus]
MRRGNRAARSVQIQHGAVHGETDLDGLRPAGTADATGRSSGHFVV